MKLCARNRVPGTVVDVVRGSVTSHVRLEPRHGVIVAAAVTNEAV